MNSILSFLSNNISRDTHIRLSGNHITIKEADHSAQLKDISLVSMTGSSTFAFVMDRKRFKICSYRSKKCQKTRDKCNSLNSKVCSFFDIKEDIHVGCDGIVVTEHNGEIIFYVCELKSINTKGFLHKFKMAKALVMYLCETAQSCGCTPVTPKIQFMLFRLSPPGRKQPMRRPTTKEVVRCDEGLTFLDFVLPTSTMSNQRQFNLLPHSKALYTWKVEIA